MPPVYAVDALPYIRSMLGHGYFAGGCRCEIPCDTQDCSGYIVAGTRSAGLYIPCISSAGFAVWGRQAGTLISEAEALVTPCAVAIKGPNGGEAGNGPLGHIVWMVGDGSHTYEAMGRRYGIVVGQAQGRGFVRWMHVPGLTYGPKPPPFSLEPTMIQQHYHYDAGGKPTPIADVDANGKRIYATIAPSFDGKGVDCDGGASLYGDQPTGVAGHRRYTPSDLGGARIVSVCEWVPKDPATVPGALLRYSDGRRHAEHFS